MEESVLSNLNFEIPFFFRYVDDCVTAISKDQISETLTAFNKYHKRIQFTIEIENENTLNFLDLTLHRESNYITTEWYTKKTWSSRYFSIAF